MQRMKRLAMARGLVLAVVLALAPMAASGVTLSTGDVILASDEIASIQLSADIGPSSTISYSAGTTTLAITASVSTINFLNKGPISGIPTGDILFAAVLTLTGAPTFATHPAFPNTPLLVGMDFVNGVVADFTIVDVGGGGAGQLLAADYIGALTIGVQGNFVPGFVTGELSGDFNVLGPQSNADFASAFGSAGAHDSTLAFGVGTTCTFVVNCPGPFTLKDWAANPTSTLTPLVTPEPALSLAIPAALAGLAAWRRRR